ncbi:carcinine hydrolase/isopenicillin-N N-acyltransferase family protein [Dialister sp.]|uniref:carcinine hydrolase/isopenicillin-N N-acyltransferase family protein n=1 Tax=Dialister sp. TaxID=1955814 RepID=UPI002E80F4BD|nr:carcinine hydrolase/isopenicillin-N N-acyltransferase family protein [Dialister sp.]MEE3452554.1 carcinine hydrolase/isopenicillin-N N-acyltransferase family protein [Dialister sp.]
MKSFKKTILAFAALLALSVPSAFACTLWGANGSEVEGGGTILVKNRDWVPQYQEMKYGKGEKYRYYGLYGGDEKKMFLRGGVNEKGLAVFSAAASVIPRKERKEMGHSKKSALREILGSCATVEEALEKTGYFKGPKFLMIGDAHSLVYVEIGADGAYQIKRVENGTLAHTNHYLSPDFGALNRRLRPSTTKRLSRISELLSENHEPWALWDMTAFGADPVLWRKGEKVETLATIGVWLHEDALPDIYVKVRYNPWDETEDVYELEGKDLFPAE